VDIGNPDLIEKRHHHQLSQAPGGVLSDYVPFYFTPLSMMAFNIHTGHNGIRKRDGSEIVILVSSLHRLKKDGVQFLFSDRHASTVGAQFTSDLGSLPNWIDWNILQRRDFSRDNDDIGKTDRYQAEALVYRHLPVGSWAGIACYDDGEKVRIERLAGERGLELKIIAKKGWYF